MVEQGNDDLELQLNVEDKDINKEDVKVKPAPKLSSEKDSSPSELAYIPEEHPADQQLKILKEEMQFLCGICYEEIYSSSTTTLSCSHRFCTDCLRSYYTFLIEKSGNIANIPCPDQECKQQQTKAFLASLLPPEVMGKYDRFQENLLVAQTSSMMFCPSPQCGKAINMEALFRKKKQTCPHCQAQFCSDCKTAWHEGITCKENKKKTETLNLSECPKCSAAIEKLSGCQHMICTNCKYEWCWICGMKYNSVIHYAILSGIMCEFIGLVMFKLNGCLRIIIMILVTLFLPLLVYLGAVLFSAVILWICLEYLTCKKIANMSQNLCLLPCLPSTPT